MRVAGRFALKSTTRSTENPLKIGLFTGWLILYAIPYFSKSQNPQKKNLSPEVAVPLKLLCPEITTQKIGRVLTVDVFWGWQVQDSDSLWVMGHKEIKGGKKD